MSTRPGFLAAAVSQDKDSRLGKCPQGHSSAGTQNSLADASAGARNVSADMFLIGQNLAGSLPDMKTVLYCRVSTLDQTVDHHAHHGVTR